MRILVTGGAGFIGSNFVYYMLSAHPEDTILCVDCLTYAGNLSTLEKALKNPNFKFFKTNICDREAIHEIFENEKPDAVVNFAAESHVDRSMQLYVQAIRDYFKTKPNLRRLLKKGRVFGIEDGIRTYMEVLQ